MADEPDLESPLEKRVKALIGRAKGEDVTNALRIAANGNEPVEVAKAAIGFLALIMGDWTLARDVLNGDLDCLEYYPYPDPVGMSVAEVDALRERSEEADEEEGSAAAAPKKKGRPH